LTSFPQKRVALSNGIELDVVDEGPRDGLALIFLHGFPESNRTWRHQIVHFSDRFRCIAPDQRGYRGSSKPKEVTDYTPDKIIGDVFLLADALGIETFTIIGHDWGGAIAWGVALSAQHERATRAIIANAPHPVIYSKLLYTDPEQRAAGQYMRKYRDTSHDAQIREKGLTAFVEGTAAAADVLPESDAQEREAILVDWSDGDTAIAMLNWYRATPLVVPPPDAPFEIPQDARLPSVPMLTIPTLVIWAMQDHALTPSNIVGLDEHIANLTLVKIPDCGHFVTWGAPDEVNAAMEEFLAQES